MQAPYTHGQAQEDQQRIDHLLEVMVPQPVAYLQALQSLVILILGWLSITVEVFIREQFGTRYLNWVRLIMAYLALNLGLFLIYVGQGVEQQNVLFLFTGDAPFRILMGQHPFVLAFVFMAVFHRVKIWQRDRKGELWHSLSFGTPNLASIVPIAGHDWLFFRWIEPFACLVISVLVFQAFPVVGTWLIWASVALLIKNQLLYYRQWHRILDVVDARIASQYFTRALEGKQPQETAGFTVVPALNQPVIREAFSQAERDATVAETMQESIASTASVEPQAPDTYREAVDAVMGNGHHPSIYVSPTKGDTPS